MGNKKRQLTLRMCWSSFNHKGGVGKTTNTLTVADALAREKYRVLLIDLDHSTTQVRYSSRLM
jgi:cellulose biosynthesis protein BcsQ